MRRLLLLSLFAAATSVSLPACAQVRPAGRPAGRQPAATVPPAIDPALFSRLRYRLVGPSRGGRSTTVTGVPSQPRTFYLGVASGGLFRTTDGGESWAPITDGQVPLGSTGSVAVADSDPDVIYLGTGSDGVRSNVSTGRGVYRTTDGGTTWSFSGLYGVGQIGAVRIHPTDPDIVWVAANGDIFKPAPERGVFKTVDGGRTWRQVLAIADSVGAMDVELKPGEPDVVYAWMSRLERKPWSIISGSRLGGFYKSTDGGEHWRKITRGLPGELIGKGNLAVTAAAPERIYALIEAQPGGGLYRSDDAGESWQLVNDQGSLIQRPFYYTTLGADPTDADVVYAGAEGFYKSTDGGRTMRAMRTPHGDNHDIWINPDDGRIMIQSNDGGANVSFDGGQTWSTQMNQPTAEIYGVWLDNNFPYQLYGAQQDNTTIIISSLADPYDLEAWRTGPGCETGPIMPHPTDPNIVYGSCKGQFEWMNMTTGQAKPYWIGVESLYGMPPADLVYRIQRVAPMEVSPHDPDVLYYGTQYVHRTRDRGITWERLSPDLTWNPPGRQGISGQPITRDMTGEEIYSTLYCIRESLLEPGVIWVGANDGPFHITRDNGRTWTDITPKDLLPGGRVQYIDPSPNRPGSAYFAVYRYLLGDYRPYLYRTDDYGQSWTLLTDGRNGIPADCPTRVVREDPDREGLLYAGTEFGLFISFDNGARWQSFQLNLPNVPVTDLKVHHQDLVVSTQGRSFWILDNLSSLHQLTAESSPLAITLYRPRPGYRTRTGADLLGPMIEYYLPVGTTGPVSIEILDGSGEVMNSYSSTAAPAAGGGRTRPVALEDPDQPVMPGRRGRGGAVRVTVQSGLNRFVWDIRDQAGITAPPGPYQVRLTTGSTTLIRPFDVLIDPRVAADGVTVADLVEQYEHNLRTRDLVTAVNRLSTRVREARDRLRGATGAGADTLRALAPIAAKLETEPVRYGKPGLVAQIGYLNSAGGRVDQKIGRDVLERYGVLSREFEAIRTEVIRVLGPDR
jgi:photosystem II stability/assembly factor-like uncharacterized protein